MLTKVVKAEDLISNRKGLNKMLRVYKLYLGVFLGEGQESADDFLENYFIVSNRKNNHEQIKEMIKAIKLIDKALHYTNTVKIKTNNMQLLAKINLAQIENEVEQLFKN